MGSSVRPEPDLDSLIAARRKALAAPVDDMDALIASRRAALAAPPSAPRDATALPTMPRSGKLGLGQAITGAAEQMNQGATVGLSDEIGALVGGFVADPRHPLKHFETLRKQVLAPAEALQADSPILSAAANLAGGLEGGALTGAVASAAKGAPLLAGLASNATKGQKLVNLARQAGAGAAVGGVTAAGASGGSMGERMSAVPAGAAYGAGAVLGLKGLGAVANKTGFSAGVQRLMPRAESPASATGRAFQKAGVMTTPDLANADVLRMLERGGLTVDDLATRTADAHPEQMLMDPSIGGRQMLRRARGAASIPSAGSDRIESVLVERGQGQPGRVQAALESGMGHTRENTVLRAEQLAAERKAAANVNYPKAYSAPPIEDPETLSIFNDPVFQQAHEVGRRMAAREGVQLPPLTRTVEIGGETVTELVPQPVQAFDWMKHGLDDLIETGANGSRTMGRNEARITRNKLSQALERIDADPTYADYRATRADWRNRSGVMEAQDAGLDFLKTPRDEIAANFPRMSADQQHEFRRNAVAQIEEKLAGVQDGRDVTRLFQNPLMREKMETIFPTLESYQQFAKQIAAESEMHATNQFVRVGSPTARIEAEKADGMNIPFEAAAEAIQGRPGGLLRNAARALGGDRVRGLNEAQVNAIAPILTARGPDMERVIAALRAMSAQQAQAAVSTKGARVTGQVAGQLNAQR